MIGYALNSKAYRVLNKISLIVVESIHIVLHETNAAPRNIVHDDGLDFEDLKV